MGRISYADLWTLGVVVAIESMQRMGIGQRVWG